MTVVKLTDNLIPRLESQRREAKRSPHGRAHRFRRPVIHARPGQHLVTFKAPSVAPMQKGAALQCSTRSWKSLSALTPPRKRTTAAGLNHETQNSLASSSNREKLETFYSAARVREDAPIKACRRQLLDTRQIAASVVLLTSNPSLIDLITRSLHTVQSLTTPSAPNPAAVLTRVPRFPAAGRDDDRGKRERARSRAIIQG